MMPKSARAEVLKLQSKCLTPLRGRVIAAPLSQTLSTRGIPPQRRRESGPLGRFPTFAPANRFASHFASDGGICRARPVRPARGKEAIGVPGKEVELEAGGGQP